VLIISSTILGDLTATGSLVKNMFTGWPKSSLSQVYVSDNKDKDSTVCDKHYKLTKKGSNINEILSDINRFSPQIIYYRPHYKPFFLHGCVQEILKYNDSILVMHMMDDWPERIRSKEPEKYPFISRSLDSLFTRSSLNFAISMSMATEYLLRYGKEFRVLHNFISPDDWLGEVTENNDQNFVVRYCGSLAHDMQLEAIYEIASTISELSNSIKIRFEIYVNDAFLKNTRALRKLPGCSVHKQVKKSEYVKLLCDADALIIASNFDDESILYTRLSLANKLPEYMASGTPIFAYGPLDVETIAFCKRSGVISMLTEHDITKLRSSILNVYNDREKGRLNAKNAKEYVDNNMNVTDKRSSFHKILKKLIPKTFPINRRDSNTMILGEYQRGSKIYFPEHELIYQYASNSNQVMINVGAHYGSSLAPFLNNGWKVYAFEPDIKNRIVLEKKYHSIKNLEILPDAVSDYSETDQPFYTSKQSSGISTLKPFDKTHKITDYICITTLDKFCAERRIRSVGFLMIDAEGFDLQVLRGFPWSDILPEYIVCEFENKKSSKLEYSFYDLADYLQARGYYLLISEWYPIKQYGTQHDFRCLKHYPCLLEDENAWGNIIAFRDEPDWSRVYEISGSLSVPKRPVNIQDIVRKIRTKARI